MLMSAACEHVDKMLMTRLTRNTDHKTKIAQAMANCSFTNLIHSHQISQLIISQTGVFKLNYI